MVAGSTACPKRWAAIVCSALRSHAVAASVTDASLRVERGPEAAAQLRDQSAGVGSTALVRLEECRVGRDQKTALAGFLVDVGDCELRDELTGHHEPGLRVDPIVADDRQRDEGPPTGGDQEHEDRGQDEEAAAEGHGCIITGL